MTPSDAAASRIPGLAAPLSLCGGASRPSRLPRLALLVSIALFVAGCAVAPQQIPQPSRPVPGRVPDEAAPRAPGAPEAPRPRVPQEGARTAPADLPGRSSAEPERPDASPSLALLEQGRSERAAGSYAAAASSIERALRIDPNNAVLWLELGEIKLADDDAVQAQMMGRKALTLAGGDRGVAARAERLIERARCGSGGC